MEQIKNSAYFLVATSLLFLFSCNDKASTNEATAKDTTSVAVSNSDTPSMPVYDPAMDPLTVGAKMSKKLGDTLDVKMYEFTVKPGESWGLHTHPHHTVYMLQGGKMALYRREVGRQDTLTLPTGMALISGPLTDSGRNIGHTTIKMIITDIYGPRRK
jgi:hypothetical protein